MSKKRVRVFTEEQKANKRAYDKIYRAKNKEKIKAYRELNKEAIKSQVLAKYNSRKLQGLYVVYCLPNTDIAYAGVTSQPITRMKRHRTAGRNTSDWFILQVCKTKAEALEVEAMYHELGYDGKCNPTIMKYRKVA